MSDLITRAIRFTNTTRPNSADNRRAIQLVRELLVHINVLELEKEDRTDMESMECTRCGKMIAVHSARE